MDENLREFAKNFLTQKAKLKAKQKATRVSLKRLAASYWDIYQTILSEEYPKQEELLLQELQPIFEDDTLLARTIAKAMAGKEN